MRIKHIKVSNFKSFDKIDVELGAFTVLVGPNASGKSNFVEVFRFLRDIAQDGLRNAVSMQGDVPFLRNVALEPERKLEIGLVIQFDELAETGRSASRAFPDYARIYEAEYSFSLEFADSATGFSISNENAVFKLDYVQKTSKARKPKAKPGSAEIIMNRKGEKVSYDKHLASDIPPKLKNAVDRELEFIEHYVRSPRRSPAEMQGLALEGGLYIPFFGFGVYGLQTRSLQDLIRGIGIYDFDPKMAKKAVQITGKNELEGDGNNLALVLSRLLDNAEDRRKFLNLVKDLLPFVQDIGVSRIVDRSLLFTLSESYSPHVAMPASLISDGTINITALLLALHFQHRSTIIIEEPERNVHPHLMTRVMAHLKEAAQTRQIIVTTHNPELVKYAPLDDLLLISRGANGFSEVNRPAQSETVGAFLKNEIGVEDLLIQNLLGV